MFDEKHEWIRSEILYCPEAGELHILKDGTGKALYDMGQTQLRVEEGICPECGERVPLPLNYDKEDFALEMLEEQGEE